MLYGEDIYVDYRFYDKVQRPALFPFGYGLSYTTFELSDLRVNATSDKISVYVCVKNTGSRAGAEVVQVYVKPVAPSIMRPVKELKGFEKVYLEPDEQKEIQIELESKYSLSFWDESRDAWKVEKGDYKILVGNSSRCDDFLEASIAIEKTYWWTGL